AGDGEKALQITMEQQPEIVISDIRMPVLDGIEYLRRIQSWPERPRVLVLSGFNDFELVKEAMKLGAADYLLKLKMEPEDLLRALEGIRLSINECRAKADADQFYNRQVLNNMPVLQRNFLRDILRDTGYEQPELLKTMKFLDIRLDINRVF